MMQDPHLRLGRFLLRDHGKTFGTLLLAVLWLFSRAFLARVLSLFSSLFSRSFMALFSSLFSSLFSRSFLARVLDTAAARDHGNQLYTQTFFHMHIYMCN